MTYSKTTAPYSRGILWCATALVAWTFIAMTCRRQAAGRAYVLLYTHETLPSIGAPPVGTLAAYCGNTSQLPTEWVACDGKSVVTDIGSVPDYSGMHLMSHNGLETAIGEYSSLRLHRGGSPGSSWAPIHWILRVK